MQQFRNYIDGRFIESSARFEDIDPATGAVIGEAHEADADLVDRAVAAGRAALAGPWGRSTAEDRAALLDRIAAGIDARASEFVAAEVADTGRPAGVAAALDVARAAANFRSYAAQIRVAGADAWETPTADGAGAINYTIRKPLGVVAVIAPWNLPLLLLTWKVAPALACGNAVIAKPSEETPGSATLLAEVIDDAGVPPGVFNLLLGFGEGSTGEAMTAHPGIDGITFTGESATGEAIMRHAARGVRPVSFELGGKNAAIVFADADFDAAVAGVSRSSFFNTGQVCLCSERVYVERSIYPRFVAALAALAQAFRIGDPHDPATTMGPLISGKHRERVLGYFDLARSEGAEVVTGGGVPDLPGALAGGFFVQPTIWTGLTNAARCVQEEVFGPVCHVMPFDDEDEAVALANDSRYGLAAAVWTGGLARAHRVAARLDVGLVWVNTWFLRDLRAPFGGVKLSGLGREGGRHSLDFYSEYRNVCIHL